MKKIMSSNFKTPAPNRNDYIRRERGAGNCGAKVDYSAFNSKTVEKPFANTIKNALGFIKKMFHSL